MILQKIAGWILEGFFRSVAAIPVSVRFFIGDILGLLWFDVFRIRRQIVLDNLKKAFPEMSLEERTRVGRTSLRYMGRGFMEYYELPFLEKNDLQERVEWVGLENLDKAIAGGRGGCLLTLHLGNGDYAIAGLSLLGYPMHLISKEFSIRWLNTIWFALRARVGTNFISPRNSSYAILKALKKNGLVIFVMDQFMGPPLGTRTQFFGHETGTTLGLAVIAHRSEAPVIPCYTYKNKDGKNVVVFEKALSISEDPAAREDELHKKLTQMYTSILEDFVRMHPEQWMWVHRRWKEFRE